MIIPFVIALAVIIVDQISKYIVKSNMELGESFNLIKNVLNIRFIENKGASFGILKDHRLVFMILSSVAIAVMLVAILYICRKSVRKNNRFIGVTLGLMFGGGIGNMIDRFFNESVSEYVTEKSSKVVVDFLEFDFVDFAVFNLADSFICVGSILFCICIFLGKYSLQPDTPPQEIEEIEADEDLKENNES